MTFLLLGATLGMFAFASGWAIGLLLSATWPRLVDCRSARMAFAMGVAPLAFAIAAVVALVGPSFAIYEPRHTREVPGVLLLIGGGAGFALLTRTAVRLVRITLVSHRVIREWARHATPLTPIDRMPAMAIDAAHPVVLVAGVRHAALYIDRRVLATCSDEEIDAIVAHEWAHVRSADNTKRLLLAAVRGPQHPLVVSWRDAAELDADCFAASDEKRGLALASALVKVARAATSPRLDAIAASGIHDGGNVESRVHALLMGRPPQQRSNRTVALAIAVALIASVPLAWRPLHEAAELLVNYVP